MILPKKILRIFLTYKYQKMSVTIYYMVCYFLLLFKHVHCMHSFEVRDMELFCMSLSSKIQGMKAIGLWCSKRGASVYLPRPISIPQSPSSIFDVKMILKPLSKSKYLWMIYGFYDMMSNIECYTFDFEQYFRGIFSFNCDYRWSI